MYLVWRAPCLVCDLLPCADLKTGLFPKEILDSVGETGEPPAGTSMSLTEMMSWRR